MAGKERRGFLTLNRVIFFSIALVLASLPTLLFADFLWRTEIDGPKIALIVLFAMLAGNIAWGATHAICGFADRRLGRSKTILDSLEGVDLGDLELPAVAVALPVYNEDPQRVFAGLRAMYESLMKTGKGDAFDFFILSDSNQSERWVEEEERWATLCRDLNAFGRINYRRREVNTDKKAGNILEFCQDWGKRYRYMITLDADSVMEGEDLVRLAQLMEVNPQVGICQTAPRVVFGESLWGRMQQFSNRFYGPVFMAGLEFWQQGDGNYWGHNAIIRMAAFMEHCALPDLPGREPFGGKILSHDFVEAALMRRAGYEVWLAGTIEGSYEEGPQDMIEHAKRDRRWCQGNLQHFWLLCSPGLLPASRIHLANGIFGYASSLLWLAFLALGAIVAFNRIRSQLSLLPTTGFANFWDLTILQHGALVAVITLGLLFVPKALGWLDVISSRARRSRYGGLRKATASVMLEFVLSVLVAPVFMLYHSRFVVMTALGKGVTWKAQKREAGSGLSLGSAMRAHWGHSLTGVVAAALGYGISDAFFAWLCPVWFGLLVSPITSYVMSKPQAGSWLRRRRVLLTPEEVTMPPTLRAVQYHLGRERAALEEQPADSASFVRAAVNPYLNAIRITLEGTEDRASDADLALVHRALSYGAEALTAEERLRILRSRRLMGEIHHRLWSLDPNELHGVWKQSIEAYALRR